MSDQPKLGKLIEGDDPGRDAIHVAILPAVAGEKLRPGDDVGLHSDGKAGNRALTLIGIVDPFLNEFVKPGQRFYICLYPGTITSLRHEWTHPMFSLVEAEAKPANTTVAPADYISHTDHVEKSKAWIKDHATTLGLTDDVLMEDAGQWLEWGDHRVQHGSERWRDCFNATEFWHHYEIVTGKVVPDDKKHSFYCCTC